MAEEMWLTQIDLQLPATWCNYGFEGPHHFGTIRSTSAEAVSDCSGGLYILTHRFANAPFFLDEGPVKIYKGKSASYPVPDLASRWQQAESVVYIGKADGKSQNYSLQTRLMSYIDWGNGKTGHSGGRSIWQIKQVDELSLWWKCLDPGVPESSEKSLLKRFKQRTGQYPFANRRG